MNGYLLAIIGLVLCSTFFSGTETAFSSVSKIKMKNLAADDNKRATYDRYGEDGLKNAGFDTGGPFAGGFGNLNDIFESFFGGFGGFGFGGMHDPNAPQRGDDLRYDVKIKFEDAVFGLDKEIKFQHLEVCPDCNGTGAQKGSKPKTCPQCNGAGQVQTVARTPSSTIRACRRT